MIDTLWRQNGPRALWWAMLAASILLALYAAWSFTQARSLESRIEQIAGAFEPAGEPNADQDAAADNDAPRRPGDARRADASSANQPPAEAAAQRVAQRYLFMPAPPQGFRSVQGVLGDRVLYPGGQSFGIGDNAMGAVVTAIGSNWVELEHEGETLTLDIFSQAPRGPELFRLNPDDKRDADAMQEPMNDKPRRAFRADGPRRPR